MLLMRHSCTTSKRNHAWNAVQMLLNAVIACSLASSCTPAVLSTGMQGMELWSKRHWSLLHHTTCSTSAASGRTAFLNTHCIAFEQDEALSNCKNQAGKLRLTVTPGDDGQPHSQQSSHSQA